MAVSARKAPNQVFDRQNNGIKDDELRLCVSLHLL